MHHTTSLICLLLVASLAVARSNTTDVNPDTVCIGDGDCVCPPNGMCTCQNAGDCFCGNSEMCLCQNGGDCYCGGTSECLLENQGYGFCSGEIKTDNCACYAMEKPMTPQSILCVPQAYNSSTLPVDWETYIPKGGMLYACPTSGYATIVTATVVPLSVCIAVCVFTYIVGVPLYGRFKYKKQLVAEYKARVDRDNSNPKYGVGMSVRVFHNRLTPRCNWLSCGVRFSIFLLLTVGFVLIAVYLMNHSRWTLPFAFFPMYMPVVCFTYFIYTTVITNTQVGVFVVRKAYPTPLLLKLDPARGEVVVAEDFDAPRDQLRFVEPLANITEAIVARPFHVPAEQAESESVMCVYLARKGDAPWFTSPCLTFQDPASAATACNDINNFLASYRNGGKPITSDPQTTESTETHRNRRAARVPFVAPRWHEYIIPAVIEAPAKKGYEAPREAEARAMTIKGGKAYGAVVPLEQIV